MSKEVILTGLRANNDLQIGNYFGAILPIVDMARKHSNDYQINMFVPDLHSFTTPIDHSKLQDQIMNAIRIFVAAGLPIENENVFIYRQSYIPAHSELTVILNGFTGMGQMLRMTQFVEKSHIGQKGRRLLRGMVLDELEKQSNLETSVGLFDYPVLMAADILLYNANYIPVGDDQTQHLEFTRDIAQRMNAKFDDLFTVPYEVKKQHAFFSMDQGLRIMDLIDPTKKMSKSDASGRGVIFLSDSPEEARKKIMGATTDSENLIVYDPKNRPGLSNLIEILGLLDTSSPMEVAKRFEGQIMYGPLKTELADKMAGFLSEFQENIKNTEDEKIMEKLLISEKSMNEVASKKLSAVQKAVGLR